MQVFHENIRKVHDYMMFLLGAGGTDKGGQGGGSTARSGGEAAGGACARLPRRGGPLARCPGVRAAAAAALHPHLPPCTLPSPPPPPPGGRPTACLSPRKLAPEESRTPQLQDSYCNIPKFEFRAVAASRPGNMYSHDDALL